MDLAKFLEARIAEDEAVAKAAFGPGIALNWPALPAAVDVFVDRYGPLRAVREAGAKRKIVAEHVIDSEPEIITTVVDLGLGYGRPESTPTGRTTYWCSACDHDRDYGHIGGPDEGCLTLRALAAIYADHPDFDPAWKE